MKKNVQETSLEAFEDIQEKIGDRQLEILLTLRKLCAIQTDATDYEIAIALGKRDPNYVRPRRWELVNQLKLVGFSRKRICQVTGKKALAWKVLDRRLKEYDI